jgi:hypothetical protein
MTTLSGKLTNAQYIVYACEREFFISITSTVFGEFKVAKNESNFGTHGLVSGSVQGMTHLQGFNG